MFAQNTDCGYTLERLGEAVLTSTHNLCFGAKIRKIGISLHTQVLLYIKVGFKGVYMSRICFPDVSDACLTLDNAQHHLQSRLFTHRNIKTIFIIIKIHFIFVTVNYTIYVSINTSFSFTQTCNIYNEINDQRI